MIVTQELVSELKCTVPHSFLIGRFLPTDTPIPSLLTCMRDVIGQWRDWLQKLWRQSFFTTIFTLIFFYELRSAETSLQPRFALFNEAVNSNEEAVERNIYTLRGERGGVGAAWLVAFWEPGDTVIAWRRSLRRSFPVYQRKSMSPTHLLQIGGTKWR